MYSCMTYMLISCNDSSVSTKNITMVYFCRKFYENKMASIAVKLQNGPKFYVSIKGTLQAPGMSITDI
jgi:hypothetical protein